MKITKKCKTIGLVLFCLVLIAWLFKWIDYLTTNDFIIEQFSNNFGNISGKQSNTVDLPLTTTYSCNNFCGPTSVCSITGQQCLSDVDCSGCNPESDPISYNYGSSSSSSSTSTSTSILGDNDAGKLTFGSTSPYSSLTSGYGTTQRVITSNMYSKPITPNFGTNNWSVAFKETDSLFNKRYKIGKLKFMPNYPERYSLTGEFVVDGPFASNATIPNT